MPAINLAFKQWADCSSRRECRRKPHRCVLCPLPLCGGKALQCCAQRPDCGASIRGHRHLSVTHTHSGMWVERAQPMHICICALLHSIASLFPLPVASFPPALLAGPQLSGPVRLRVPHRGCGGGHHGVDACSAPAGAVHHAPAAINDRHHLQRVSTLLHMSPFWRRVAACGHLPTSWLHAPCFRSLDTSEELMARV